MGLDGGDDVLGGRVDEEKHEAGKQREYGVEPAVGAGRGVEFGVEIETRCEHAVFLEFIGDVRGRQVEGYGGSALDEVKS